MSRSKWIYSTGKQLLVAAGVPEHQAGGLISKWLREHGEEATAHAIERARAKDSPKPIEFITGILREKRGGNALMDACNWLEKKQEGQPDERFDEGGALWPEDGEESSGADTRLLPAAQRR